MQSDSDMGWQKKLLDSLSDHGLLFLELLSQLEILLIKNLFTIAIV